MPDQITVLANFQTVPDSEVYASRVDIVGTGKVDLVTPPPGILLYPGTVGQVGGELDPGPGSSNKHSLFIANGDSQAHNFRFWLNNGEEDLPLSVGLIDQVEAGEIKDVTGIFEAWEGGIPYGYVLKVQIVTDQPAPIVGRILFVGSFARVSLNKDETR